MVLTAPAIAAHQGTTVAAAGLHQSTKGHAACRQKAVAFAAPRRPPREGIACQHGVVIFLMRVTSAREQPCGSLGDGRGAGRR